MAGSTVTVGLLGAGYIAGFAHLAPLGRVAGADLVAISDRDAARARKTASRFGVPRVYSTLEEMLSGERLDLLDICLPPQQHHDALVTAIERGVHCLVEKPLAVSTADADHVISLASERGVGLYVLHNYSVVPAVMRAKRMVERGAIGDVIGVNVSQFVLPHDRYLEPDHWCHSLPGEYFSDLAPHLAMLLVEFIGAADEATATTAKLNHDSPLRFDELRITARNSRALGTIECSLNCPAFVFTMEIVGTQGEIQLSGDYQAVVRHPPVGQHVSALARGMGGVKDILTRTGSLARTAGGVLAGRYRPLTMGHHLLIERCVRTLQGKTDYPLPTSSAREAVRLLEMAFGQAGDGRG